MVGIGRDDVLQALGVGVFGVGLVEVQRDGRAAPALLAGLDRELALAVGDPAPRLVGARLARDHLDLVRHHEGGIEADAELADQGHVLLGVARELVKEGGGARARDGAEIVDQLLPAHADAVVG